ncbi:MAG: DNA polymerase III subunit alpha [Alphaproteobacteria bacterium]
MPDFIHLHIHTAFSLLESAIKVGALVKKCQSFETPAVAMTDKSNLFGAMEFSSYCAGSGIQPIIGCHLNISRESKNGKILEPDALVLLSQNDQGYRNLLKLVSASHLSSPEHQKPQVSLELLEHHNKGLIALSGGIEGAVGRFLLEENNAEAEENAKRLSSIFENRFYIELMRHGLKEEDFVEPKLIDLAYKFDIPLVATNQAYFLDKNMFEAHDALICIQDRSFVDQADRRRLTPEHYLKSPEEMKELFSDIPEAIENTVSIAKRCALMVEAIPPILPPFTSGGAEGEKKMLREKAKQGLEERLKKYVFNDSMKGDDRDKIAQTYYKRMEHELEVIEKMGFAGYFLIVSDFISWAKAHNVPVGPGRGSGAGSLVAWSILITDLDPTKFGLLFERFLNPERISMPDFDVDFCQDKRGKVIEYVQQKYGKERVAQIITFGKLQARAVLRDVGRVLQMPYGQVDRICKMIPNAPGKQITLTDAIAAEPELQKMREDDAAVAKMLDIGIKLEGLYRHASTHAAGVVIGDRPLDELIPLYIEPDSESDMPVTQFDMKWIEKAGLIKFDFLGLKTLTVLAQAVDIVKQTKGLEIDLSSIPIDDKETYELLHKADTAGVFQLESSGMRDTLKKLQPDSIEEITAIVSLYRPGPMDNIPSYIARKHGLEKPDYLHPSLEPVLKETYGIMIYQEQVMQIAQILGGYTLGGADILRRAMGKKKKEEMDNQRQIFLSGAKERGVDEGQASHIFDLMAKFADYGFNKSHAAAYAVIAYQTAYMKAHHPVEFMAATMNLELNNTDKLRFFKEEIKKMGVEILPPSINKSQAMFSVENGSLRYSLAAVKNVSRAAMEEIVETRGKKTFKSLTDFARRVKPEHLNKRQLENLAKAGAFDDLEKNRNLVFGNAGKIMQHAQAAFEEKASTQNVLFQTSDIAPEITFDKMPHWTTLERLRNEAEAIGFYLSAHPLDDFEKSLKKLRVVKSVDLKNKVASASSSKIKIAGSVNAVKQKISKSGNRYAFVELSDSTGVFEVTFFAETLAASRELLNEGEPVLITVSAEKKEDESIRLTALSVQSLSKATANLAEGLVVSFDDDIVIDKLKDIIAQDKKGRNNIYLKVKLKDCEVEIKLSGGFAIEPSTVSSIRNTQGIVEVEEL